MKKNVLIVQQYFYPDVSAVAQLVSRLIFSFVDDEAIDFTVLCSDAARPAQQQKKSGRKQLLNDGGTIRVPARRTINGTHIRSIPTLNFQRRSLFNRVLEMVIFYGGVFLFLLTHRKYHSVVSFTSPPLIGFFVWLGMTFSKARFLYYIEDLYPELLFDMGYITRYWIIQKLSFINKILLRKADKVITLSSYMTRKLRCNYFCTEKKIVEIPNWSNHITYSEPAVWGKHRAAIGAGPGSARAAHHEVGSGSAPQGAGSSNHRSLRLLYSGNLGLAHDFSLLPLLLGQFLKNDLPVSLVFYGGGHQYERIRRMVGKTGYPACSFEGYIDQEQHNLALAGAHFFLVAQKEETIGDILPSKLYSYLAAGRPLLLLGSRKSEIGELIKREGIGSILETEDDVTEVIRYIAELNADWDRYKATCGRVRHVYTAGYGFNKSRERFRDVLLSV